MTGAADGLTEDRLMGGRVKLRQPRRGFRAGLDSVLLAAAVPAAPGDRVVEPGAGAGAAALCLARRVDGCRVTGLEKDAALAALARANARLNRLEARVDVLAGDVADPPPALAPGAWDHAMLNPPFLAPGRSRPPPRADRAAARIEDGAGLAAWVAFAAAMLRAGGTLTLIHRADRLADALAAFGPRAGEVVVFPLWPRAGRPAKRVLIRARIGAAGPLRLAPGLVLHGADGAFTPAAEAALRGAALEM